MRWATWCRSWRGKSKRTSMSKPSRSKL